MTTGRIIKEKIIDGTKLIGKVIKENIGYIIVIISVLLLKAYVISPVMVSGESMYSTLHDKDIMLLQKINYNKENIKREDIIVINFNDKRTKIVNGKSVQKEEKKFIIKRVIGLPGDKIFCIDNEIFINGKKIKEKYLDKGKVTPDFEEIKLKDDEYFVLGDNREISLDSTEIGPIKYKDIEGKAIFTIFPFNRWGSKK